MYPARRLSTRAFFLGLWSRVCGWRICEKQKKSLPLHHIVIFETASEFDPQNKNSYCIHAGYFMEPVYSYGESGWNGSRNLMPRAISPTSTIFFTSEAPLPYLRTGSIFFERTKKNRRFCTDFELDILKIHVTYIERYFQNLWKEKSSLFWDFRREVVLIMRIYKHTLTLNKLLKALA